MKVDFTGFFRYDRSAPEHGATKPAPKEGIRRFFFIFFGHFWELIALNLLFVAFCIPVITIPAAFCGMNKVLIKLVREGNCFLWSDFIQEFKGSFKRSIPFGILFAFLIFDIVFLYNAGFTENGDNAPIAALMFFLFGATALYFGYLFVLIPAVDLKNKDIARNALLLMLTQWKTNIVMLTAAVSFLFLLWLLAWYSLLLVLPVLVIINFSLYQLIICTAVDQPMQKYIIGPHGRGREGE